MANPVAPPAGVTIPINRFVLAADTSLHRIHPSRFGPDAFNPGFGHARFSPFSGQTGSQVPTLYAADTLPGAMMESIFHDVSLIPAAKTYHQDKLKGQVMSELVTTQSLPLVDLSSVSLKKMGLERQQLIDTEAIHYPVTQQWAQVLHAQNPDVVGLSWISRQDDTCRAYMFFGDRVPTGAFHVRVASEPLFARGTPIMPVYELAIRLGVNIVS